MMMKCTECGVRLVRRTATRERPFHFTFSGLPNVYLVGVEIHQCPNGHGESPVIPRMGSLVSTIAGWVIAKPTLLTGAEIRYLRKWAGMEAQEFAARLGVTKTWFSHIENGRRRMSVATDKLVRVIAAVVRSEADAVRQVALSVAGNEKAAEQVTLQPTARGWKAAA